jgi:hypothetical protein
LTGNEVRPVNTQPSPSARRITWYVEGVAWRVEYVAGRWSLSRYQPTTEQWQRVGSYPNRKAAISAAYGEENHR